MRKISTSAIESGMVLAKPVKGPSGNVILQEGAVLQAGLATRLQSWGISIVYVVGDSAEGESESNEKKVDPAQIEKVLLEKFVNVKDDPLMKMIYQETFTFLLKKGN
jgi:hypothetical protein